MTDQLTFTDPVTRFPDQLVIRIEPEDLNQHFANCGLVFDDDKAFHRVVKWRILHGGSTGIRTQNTRHLKSLPLPVGLESQQESAPVRECAILDTDQSSIYCLGCQ